MLLLLFDFYIYTKRIQRVHRSSAGITSISLPISQNSLAWFSALRGLTLASSPAKELLSPGVRAEGQMLTVLVRSAFNKGVFDSGVERVKEVRPFLGVTLSQNC